jgi:crotonobetainyl-CoA:carnitine CoA-transferase CaiB-like acyl-CoA transferase
MTATFEHAAGNIVLRRELAAIFATRTTAQWMALAADRELPIAPVYDAVAARHRRALVERRAD